MCRLHLGIGSVRWQCRKAQRCENRYQGRKEPAHPPSQNRIRTSSHLRAHVCHTFPLSSLHCRLGTVRASMPQHHDFFRSILIVISPRYDNKRFISVSHYLLTYSFCWIITPTGGGIYKLEFPGQMHVLQQCPGKNKGRHNAGSSYKCIELFRLHEG